MTADYKNKFYKIEKSFGFETDIKWPNAIFIILYHVLAAFWCWHYAFPVKWQVVVFAVFMYVLSGLGVTCGVHRYWTHRSYKATLPLQILLLFMFSCASQRVKKHFFLYLRNILWINLLCCFVLPTLAGVWLWGEVWQTAAAWQCFIRYAGAFHSEFTVNSLAHAYGCRPYNKSIAPAESWYVSLTTMGEGWHNYHHMFPYDYKAAEYCDFLNLSTAFIRMCRRVGWAYDLREATPEAVRSLAKRLGDGTAIKSDF